MVPKKMARYLRDAGFAIRLEPDSLKLEQGKHYVPIFA
jgi:hypothetical protein